MIKFSLLFIQFLICLQGISQEGIVINLQRVADEKAKTISQSFSIKQGSWKAAFEDLSIGDLSFDSTFVVNANVDYFQTIFQAYNKGKMPKSFFDNQIVKWGLDTTKLSKQPIKSYVSALIAFQGKTPYLFLDSNNNGIIADDRAFPDSSALGKHILLFDRHQDGITKQDSLMILINDIDYQEKRVSFKYIEERIGTFSFQNKNYKVELKAMLNDYSFDELSQLTISSVEEVLGKYSLNDIVKFDEGQTFQISHIARDGQTIELTRYKHEKPYSLQVGNFIPLFEGTDIKGQRVGIEDFKGKYTLVYLWNSTCAASTYTLKELVNKLMDSDYDLNLFSIALDKKQNIPVELLGDDKSSSLVVESAAGPINKIFRTKVFPTYYLVNPEGKILLKSEMGVNPKSFEKSILTAMELDRKKWN